MSNILTKPFSWTNRIIRAVFKGSPNLTTTSDLNRQIEALKKEMYTLQQASAVVISDMEATITENGTFYYKDATLTVSLSYVYCLGMRFDFSYQGDKALSYVIPLTSRLQELRMYARKELITYSNDSFHEISGAKFEDGTSQAAADHYVYIQPELVLAEPTSPDNDFQYALSNGKEYICTLLRVERMANPDTGGYYPINSYVQNLTVPMGRGSIDASEKYARFTLPDLAVKSRLAKDLVLRADDDWKDVVHKLWSRLYTLEKRLFMETLYGEDTVNGGNVTSTSIGGIQHSRTRRFVKTGTNETTGAYSFIYNFYLVGNICFVAGRTTFEKNTLSDPDTALSFTIGSGSNEMPHSLWFEYTANAFHIQPRADLNSASLADTRIYLDGNKLNFVRVPQKGASLDWYGVYCFSSKGFWQYASGDKYGFFDDRHL